MLISEGDSPPSVQRSPLLMLQLPSCSHDRSREVTTVAPKSGPRPDLRSALAANAGLVRHDMEAATANRCRPASIAVRSHLQDAGTGAAASGPSRSLCTDQMQHELASVWGGAVLEEVNALPGAEHRAAISNRNGQLGLGEC
jgi:hypothetical protein